MMGGFEYNPWVITRRLRQTTPLSKVFETYFEFILKKRKLILNFPLLRRTEGKNYGEQFACVVTLG